MEATIAADARGWVQTAAGETNGLTVCAQVAQAFRNLRSVGYRGKPWRVRAAWFGHAGCWSAMALRELEEGYRAWDERQARLADAAAETLAALHRAGIELEADRDVEFRKARVERIAREARLAAAARRRASG